MQCLFWLLVVTANGHAWAAENPLTANTDVSNEGYFVLNWDTGNTENADDPSLSLQQSSSTQFDTVISRGIPAAGALTITGLEDGEYYFRIVRDNSPLATPVQVTVEHHSLTRAGGFFLLGLALFSTLTFIILNGNRQANI